MLRTIAFIGLTLTVASSTPAQPAPAHTMRGIVLSVDGRSRSFVVSHESVPGVMPAMTMRFDVGDARMPADVAPGVTVTFEAVFGSQGPRAAGIQVVPFRSAEQDPLTARRLKLLTDVTARRVAPIAIGQPVPEFTLTDQHRKPISLARFRGKVVAVNFIYTSCALPQFCYRMSNHFGVVQRRFGERAGRDLVLLTVTFDPARDTPERLKEYASQWQAEPGRWHFLTGGEADVQRVCDLFGVDFFPEEGLMSHSVRTAVIDRRGTLAANIEGNEFTASQLGDLLDAVMNR
jgi:protein SCO1/2